MKIEKTPIQKSGLRVNNCNIYIKRDDLIPYSFGGNKVRIAFEFYNDLVSKGYDTIVGYGSPESNLCILCIVKSFVKLFTKWMLEG